MVRGRTPDLSWRLMDAQYWASPRLARRQRIFLVADFGGRRSHEILFKPRTMQSLPAFGGDCGLPAACGDRGSFIEAGRRVPITRPFQCFRMRASAKEQTETAFRNSFGLPTDPFPTLLSKGQEDENGILFVCFPVTAIAAVLSRSPMTVKRSLNELENAGLIMRVRQGVGEPNRIYVLIPGKEDAALA